MSNIKSTHWWASLKHTPLGLPASHLAPITLDQPLYVGSSHLYPTLHGVRTSFLFQASWRVSCPFWGLRSGVTPFRPLMTEVHLLRPLLIGVISFWTLIANFAPFWSLTTKVAPFSPAIIKLSLLSDFCGKIYPFQTSCHNIPLSSSDWKLSHMIHNSIENLSQWQFYRLAFFSLIIQTLHNNCLTSSSRPGHLCIHCTNQMLPCSRPMKRDLLGPTSHSPRTLLWQVCMPILLT